MRALSVSKPLRLLTAVFLLAAFLCLAGCGSSSNKVVGKVTYQGKPVPGGIVVFYGANKWTGSSAIEEDGSYTIDKPPTGSVKITVDTSTVRPAKLPPNAPKQLADMKDMSKMPAAPKGMQPPEMPEAAKNSPLYNPKLTANRYVAIPEKYADPEKSGLTYDVKSGTQTHNIELK
jgi:hypothetical protein